MSNIAEAQKKTTWSTWEELLLAFSVKRHGIKDWDAVALELRSRSSLPALLTAQICREKYRDLQRRFTNGHAAVDIDDSGDVVIPWLDDLRELRVAELRQEVHRHDLSIQSLQSKVKRMLEERERSMKDGQEIAIEPDLAGSGKKNIADDGDKSDEIGEVVSGGNSDHENRSVNESNSAENTEAEDKCKPDPVHAKPDSQEKPTGEDSCIDSLNRHETSKTGQKSNGDDVSNDVTKEGGDVESSASLTKKRRKRGGGEQAVAPSPAIVMKRASANKSEPLVALLDVIRSHKYGRVFKRRLQIQKTDKYNRIVRNHVDLETVQARIDDGSYASCSTKFYVDLLLLFNNAVVFFPKSSQESIAAHELRALVMKKLKTMQEKNAPTSMMHPSISTGKVRPKVELDTPSSLFARRNPNTTAAPIVVCRKRSSISVTKGATPPSPHVTGVRGMRRATKGHADSTNKDEVGKMIVVKQNEGGSFSRTEKKSGAADFLKRIKRSSTTETQSKKLLSDSKGGRGEERRLKKKKRIESMTTRESGTKKSEEKFATKKNVGRPRARGRDAITDANNDEDFKRPKKRSRR